MFRQERYQRSRPRGNDASAASGRESELSEWQRSIADEGFSKPRKISGTATGLAVELWYDCPRQSLPLLIRCAEHHPWIPQAALSAVLKMFRFNIVCSFDTERYPGGVSTIYQLCTYCQRRHAAKKELQKQFLLSGLYELLPAFGTGNRDLTLPLGHSHLLAAPGTIVIAVILVF